MCLCCSRDKGFAGAGGVDRVGTSAGAVRVDRVGTTAELMDDSVSIGASMELIGKLMDVSVSIGASM